MRQGQIYGNKVWIKWALLALMENINFASYLKAFILCIWIMEAVYCKHIYKELIYGIRSTRRQV